MDTQTHRYSLTQTHTWFLTQNSPFLYFRLSEFHQHRSFLGGKGNKPLLPSLVLRCLSASVHGSHLIYLIPTIIHSSPNSSYQHSANPRQSRTESGSICGRQMSQWKQLVFETGQNTDCEVEKQNGGREATRLDGGRQPEAGTFKDQTSVAPF